MDKMEVTFQKVGHKRHKVYFDGRLGGELRKRARFEWVFKTPVTEEDYFPIHEDFHRSRWALGSEFVQNRVRRDWDIQAGDGSVLPEFSYYAVKVMGTSQDYMVQLDPADGTVIKCPCKGYQFRGDCYHIRQPIVKLAQDLLKQEELARVA